MRGEQLQGAMLEEVKAGSSPHAWGTVQFDRQKDLTGRFIPTCVGNRHQTAGMVRRGTVHPHMRGEQYIAHSGGEGTAGSSPHAWGTGNKHLADIESNRFIPTCVGNRFLFFGYPMPETVHPHMRGEQFIVVPW